MDDLTAFLNLSVVLTGFSKIELQGTGVGKQYFDTLKGTNDGTVDKLLAVWRDIKIKEPELLEKEVRKNIMNSIELGPLAENIIAMWYLGQAVDAENTVSNEAYRQGLVWTAINAHTQGANQPGFGTWSFPPNYLEGTHHE